MECLFFGVIGGALSQVGVYTYKRFASKPLDTSRMVIDTVLNAIKRNSGSIREVIHNVR